MKTYRNQFLAGLPVIALLAITIVGIVASRAQDKSSPNSEQNKNRITSYLEPWTSVQLTFPKGSEDPTRIHIEEGAKVKKGDTLAELDLSVLKAHLKMAEMRASSTAEITIATADLQVASDRFQKLNLLKKRGQVHSSEMDRAKAEVTKAKGRLERANEDKKIAQMGVEEILARIEQKIIRSPIDGVVIGIQKSGSLPNAKEQPSFHIRVAQLDKLATVCQIPVKFVKGLKPGDAIPVTVTEGKVPTHEVKGRVEFLAPTADPDSETIRVRISIPNTKGKIRSGLHTYIELPASQ